MFVNSHPSNRITAENLKEVIYWHRPSPNQIQRMENLAANCEQLMQGILDAAPDCADRTKALQYVRAARMWANSAIALEPNTPVDHTRGQG
jgi:hypothetical protein